MTNTTGDPASTVLSRAPGHRLAAASRNLREHSRTLREYSRRLRTEAVEAGKFTALEQTMMDSDDYDRGERVIAMREDFQRLMAERYTAMIEQLTGRKVIAFLSQAHVEPDITLEMFFVDRQLEGFDAVEVLDGK